MMKEENICEYRAEILNKEGGILSRIQGIEDEIYFLSSSDEGVEISLRFCVDQYIKVCAILDKEIQKPYPGRIEIPLNRKSKDILCNEAKRKKVSLEDLISDILRQYIDFIKQ